MVSMHLERGSASHPWHDLHIGADAPNIVNSVIIIPQHSKVKYQLDKKHGVLMVDRVLLSAAVYPHNFGFVPRTMVDDGNPLSVLVLMQVPVAPMCSLRAKPIGIMHMMDQGEKEDIVICVCQDDPEFKDYNDVSELPPFRLAEIRGFFQDYKKLEGKVVSVEELEGRDAATRATKEAMDLYTAMVVRDLQS
eukprot:CAMPEP_0114257060 /NCGR_PEP_ID=MMETSP0058-20121206/18513_1 /TAXON_ID=36894 /ORGANISM="Pyramimonas parkeae, CCMP726" /LENGTH=191 /DNA_ID=CAMNT_0001371725 /DNA_START=69 /DNA_END=644 /DNA_ORIENTATION=+